MKNILKIAALIAGLILIISVLSLFFDGRRWVGKGYVADRDARIAAIANEEPGTIDVLNVGDSVCNVSLTPLELFRDYGFTSYNMGRDLQRPVESYFYIKTALKQQPVKVILWESHNLFREENIFDFCGKVLAEALRYEFPFLKYHYIWKNWLEGSGIRKYYKGYLINESVKSYDGGEYYYFPDKEIYPIFPRQQMTFKFVLEYCRRRNIKVVLYSGASAFCYDIRMHNAVEKLAKECGVDYIDANYDIDKVKIDWKHDTFDKGDHLNLFGTRKMTRYLGDYLSENCKLPDRRKDPACRSWHDLMGDYEETVREMKGTSYPILEEKLKKEKKDRK